jgi:hypothetical protein
MQVRHIDVSAYKHTRMLSKKWRDLIQKVCEADPLLCPGCYKEMRITALTEGAPVIERIQSYLDCGRLACGSM